MDFKFTKEQELIRNKMREFCEKHVDPIAVEIDESCRHPVELFEKLSEDGWMGIPFPKEYGGGGSDYLTHIIAVEELSRSCSTTGFALSLHVGIACMLIFLFGTKEQKRKYLTPMAEGKHLGAFVLTEWGAGTDIMAANTTAVSDGDHYVINGKKILTSNGPTGDTYVVFAVTDKSAGKKGMSAFIIPKGTPGMASGKEFKKIGFRSSQTSEMLFKNCRIPKENLLDKEGTGFEIALAGLNHGRIGIAAQCVGIMQAALDESIRFSKKRVQFGKPIARNQAIAWMIADMAKDLSAARLLTYHAAWLKDQNLPFATEASTAKLFASEAAMQHALKAVQIHGGYGCCKGAKVERLMRDAKITEIGEGTSEAQRMVISGSLLR